MIEMELTRILIAENRDGQIIVLKEKNGERAFPIVIGFFEAAAIDRHVKEIPSPRPLTHDLVKLVIGALGGTLERIEVVDLRDSTFFGRLVIRRGDERIEVDSRPSDAIALAVLAGVPIFVAEHVLDEVCGSGSYDLNDLSSIEEAPEEGEGEGGGEDETDDETPGTPGE
jgi:uncharacterized protein